MRTPRAERVRRKQHDRRAKAGKNERVGQSPTRWLGIITCHANGKRYVSVMRSPEYAASELGELGYGDNRLLEQPATVKLTLDTPADAREQLTGKESKRVKEFELRLQPWRPVVVEVR